MNNCFSTAATVPTVTEKLLSIPGTWETVQKKAGVKYFIPIKNPGKLAEKIGMLIENPQLREIFGKKARKIAVKELDVKIAAQKHKEIYERIARLK